MRVGCVHRHAVLLAPEAELRVADNPVFSLQQTSSLFLEYDGVSPYNNHGEQQIRNPVTTRKISQQNRSLKGAEAHAIFMSFFSSAELQGVNPVEKVMNDAKSLIGGSQKENFAFKLAV